MAQILPFILARKDRGGTARAAAAEIVIFPGIRVEYHEEPPRPADEAAASGERRRRRGGARRGRPPKDVLTA